MRNRKSSLAVTLAIVLAACSPSTESGVTTSTTSPAASATSTASSASSTTASTTTLGSTTTTVLPGEPISFGPREGDVLAVVGVTHDDTLNLRAAPGSDQPILATIDPTYKDLIAQGETRDLTNAFWIKVAYAESIGWVHMGFVAYLGHTEDVTSTVVKDLGEIPTARSMRELGLMVAETMASNEPPSEIVLVIDASGGDLGEVTYDVIGLGDDAVRGLRLHVIGNSVDDGFALESVELTTLCGRDVTETGLCV